MISSRYIEEQQLLARYLADQLSHQEQEQFEAYYEEHPEVLDELQAVASAKIGLALLQRSGELTRPRAQWPRRLAMAALLLLVIGIASVVTSTTRVPPMLALAPEVLADRLGAGLPAVVHDIESTRGDVDAIIVLPPDRQALELRMRVEAAPPSTRYTVDLFAASAATNQGLARKRVATLDGVRGTGQDLRVGYVDSGSLAAGRYFLRLLDGDARDRPAAEFIIEVVTP